MAANPKSPLESTPYHVYHAEAQLLGGELKHPIKQPIEKYARVVFENNRRDGHIKASAKETTLEGLISFRAGYTRASGTRVEKEDIWGEDHSGWVTLSTSVIEGLNVFEVITADRVVAQVSTRHALTNGEVPTVTFLGTRFENLRIGGFPVEVELDLGVCGEKPAGGKAYLEDRSFLDHVLSRLKSIAGDKELPSGLKTSYDTQVSKIDSLKKNGSGAGIASNGDKKVLCSLVKKIGPIPIPGVKVFGHVIYIPEFGVVSLGEVEVGTTSASDPFAQKTERSLTTEPREKQSHHFLLNMLNMNLGCIGTGTLTGPTVYANGHGSHG